MHTQMGGKNNFANDESENAGGTILASPFTNN